MTPAGPPKRSSPSYARLIAKVQLDPLRTRCGERVASSTSRRPVRLTADLAGVAAWLRLLLSQRSDRSRLGGAFVDSDMFGTKTQRVKELNFPRPGSIAP
jgi:hypothetical protein